MEQRILFGPPGSGKSHRVRILAKALGVEENSAQLIETTFHPEYGYGDFVAKLLPHTTSRQPGYTVTGGPAEMKVTAAEAQPSIEYVIHTGPFLRALVQAYAAPDKPVLLVIDEINRGNCAQIFGDVFQLLDRDAAGRSCYGIDASRLVVEAMRQEWARVSANPIEPTLTKLGVVTGGDGSDLRLKLRLPVNLSLIGTMNTSDESVFYMDTAFKRRWNFEYLSWRGTDVPVMQSQATIEGTGHRWIDFLEQLNGLVAARFEGARVDDKQVGMWFLRAETTAYARAWRKLEALKGKRLASDWKSHFPSAKAYDMGPNIASASVQTPLTELGFTWPSKYSPVHSHEVERLADTILKTSKPLGPDADFIPRHAIQNKLMFFLWDNVFARNDGPLQEVLRKGGSPLPEPRTFGDFSTDANVAAFIEGVMHWDDEVAPPGV